MDDITLIRQCKSGKRAAFDTIINKYYLPLIRFFYNHTRDPRVCEDLTHDVVLKFMENIHKYTPISGIKFSSWLFRIAYNTYVDYVRKSYGYHEIPLDEDIKLADTCDTIEDVVMRMTYEELGRKLHLLPQSMRTLLILRYINNFNYHEIEKITGITKVKLKSRLNYSLKKLKELYEPERRAMKFLQHLEMEDLYDISRLEAKHIFSYINTLEDYSAVSIKHMTSALRLFVRYLYQNGYIQHDLSNKIGSVRRCLSRKLPSYWTKDEVITLLNSIDKGNPSEKRDYAMILLVARLGLRSGDLKKLKFENLKWSSNTIELVQSKTGVPISLPLLRDVRWAIIDYVENARPQIDSPYVFLSHNAPYLPLSEQNHLYRTLEKYMQRAHLPIVGKRRSGMHSLRHSLATTLIEQNTSLHLISDVLGHTSSNSTAIYLQTDIERLRDCALSLGEDGE